jgi:imidazolonepropionase-like amidohydrolase
MLVVILVLTGCARSPRLVTLPSPPPRAVVIRDVTVLDVVSGQRMPGRDVWVEGKTIRRIVPHDGETASPDTVVIDGHGGTLLPGLIDLHAHTGTNPAPPAAGGIPDPAANLRAYLYCGVTTVVDLGDLPSRIFDRRDAVAAGDIPGPMLYAAGPVVTAPDGHPVPVLRLVLPFWMRW